MKKIGIILFVSLVFMSCKTTTTLEYFEGTPETNPLGIYISNFDIKSIK